MCVLGRGLLILGCEELCCGTESIRQGLSHSQTETNLIQWNPMDPELGPIYRTIYGYLWIFNETTVKQQ